MRGGAWYGAFQEEPLDHFFAGVEMGLGVMAIRPEDARSACAD